QLPASSGGQQDGKESDAKLRVAKQPRAQRNRPGDGRSFVTVGRGQILRPKPVVRLVRHQLDARGKPESIHSQNHQRENRPADRAESQPEGTAGSGHNVRGRSKGVFHQGCTWWGRPSGRLSVSNADNGSSRAGIVLRVISLMMKSGRCFTCS